MRGNFVGKFRRGTLALFYAAGEHAHILFLFFVYMPAGFEKARGFEIQANQVYFQDFHVGILIKTNCVRLHL